MSGSPARAQESIPTLEFDGSGFGHGVGLSQYGAKGQALAGRSAEEIVTFYYTGTFVAAAADLPIPELEQEQPLWVGLAQDLKAVEVTWNGTGGVLCVDPDPSNQETPCIATINVRGGETMRMTWKGSLQACELVRIKVGGEEKPLAVTAPDCRISMAADEGGQLWTDSKGIPTGTIELRRDGTHNHFHVVAVVDMETYVGGLAEVPSSWPAAAVEAQALAARTFALNKYLVLEDPDRRTPGDAGLTEDAKDRCWCHVYDDTRSQVYGGVDAMAPARVAAAAATTGEVVAYSGGGGFTAHQVIEAYYSSSNPGRSVSNVDAWGSAVQYPYLVPVDDPWSIAPETGNPLASWTDSISAADLAANLGWDTVAGAWLIEAELPTVRVVGTDGAKAVSVDLRTGSLRSNAGLYSGHVTALRLLGPPTCDDHFATLWGTSGPDVLIGTGAGDVIVGLGGADVIEGRGGDDLICANGGADTIKGNGGADTIYAGNADDDVRGGAGTDIIYGGGGADTIRGGNGADDVNAGKGLDVVFAGEGIDIVRGGDGADIIDGGPGPDEVFGNAGADDLRGAGDTDVLWGGLGPDTMNGGDGTPDECRGGEGVDAADPSCEVTLSVP
jgi:hypothetical protein